MFIATSPFQQFFDIDGSPLDRGFIYFGLAGQNPETAPAAVFWDLAGTQPIAQPIRTLSGYPVRSGTPAIIYAQADYSMTVKNRKGQLVTYLDRAGGSTGLASGDTNLVINGNFAVNQRGVSGAVTLAAGEYGHDRWKGGAAGCTYTFAQSGIDTILTITAGSLVQIVEGVNVEGGSYSLGWDGSAQSRINNGAYGPSGVVATVDAGANFPLEIGIGTVGKVQALSGIGTDVFYRRPLDVELERCKRYFQLFSHQGGAVGNTNSLAFSVPTGVRMRVLPTATNLAGGAGSGYAAVYNGTTWSQSLVVANAVTPSALDAASVVCSYAYFGAVTGWPCSISVSGSFSAEL